MNPSFKKELNSLIRNPKSLLSLSEFDIRNNILKLFNNLGWNVYNNNFSLSITKYFKKILLKMADQI